MEPIYNDMNSDLRLCKGGKLYYRRWSTEDRKGEVFDVTDNPLRFLMRECELENGVTLRDVFDLIEMHIDELEPILGNWVDKFIEESKQPCENESSSEIEKLELYWFLDSDEEFGTSGMAYPAFHGIGTNGDKYGLDFSACNSIVDIPLVLKENAEILTRKQNGESSDYSTIPLPGVSYTLIQILYGIIWELSFFGPPEKRDQEAEKIIEAAKDARLHPENLISLDELRDKINEKLENVKKVDRGLDTPKEDVV